MSTKVVSYGARAPQENGFLVDDQINRAHRYYNKLVELHRAKVDDINKARKARYPEYADLEAAVANANKAVDAIAESIRAENAKARRKRATPEESATLKAAKANRKELSERLKAMRKQIMEDQSFAADLAAINTKYAGDPIDGTSRRKGGLLKDARSQCGVYWGTYLRVENAVEAALKSSGGYPRFARWTGEGAIGVQIQGGCTWEDILLGRGKVGGLIKAGKLPTQRTSERSARPWLFQIRVQSDDSLKPIWAKVHVWVHPGGMPADARIMALILHRRKLPSYRMSDGKYPDRYEWTVQLTVRTNEIKPRPFASGSCGIDLGWRLVPDGLRVAYLVGSDGHREELIVPNELLQRWEKSRSIQSIRDRNFDQIKAAVLEWKQGLADVPEWMADSTKFFGQWHAKGRLINLLNKWSENRIAGDEVIFNFLKAWREQDAHLQQWQIANDMKAQRSRLDLYRCFVSRVRQRYAKIIVEDCDWREMARKKPVDSNESANGSTAYMRIASVGKLRELLKNDGAVMVSAKNTTKTCHLCGSIEEFDHARELVHTCGVCSVPWDQDYNAGCNLLASGAALTETPDGLAVTSTESSQGDTATPSVYVGRWAKRKAARSQSMAEEVIAD